MCVRAGAAAGWVALMGCEHHCCDREGAGAPNQDRRGWLDEAGPTGCDAAACEAAASSRARSTSSAVAMLLSRCVDGRGAAGNCGRDSVDSTVPVLNRFAISGYCTAWRAGGVEGGGLAFAHAFAVDATGWRSALARCVEQYPVPSHVHSRLCMVALLGPHVYVYGRSSVVYGV